MHEKICSNCSTVGLFDSYLHHEKLFEGEAPQSAPHKLYRCRDCTTTFEEPEYAALEVTSVD